MNTLKRARRRQRTLPWLMAAIPLATLLGGCTGATVGSGVGETRLERPPYYAGGYRPEIHQPFRIAYLPVRYQPGASQAALFDPEAGEGTAVSELLDSLNHHLDMIADGRLAGPLDPPPGTSPDVQFGCDMDVTEECILQDKPRMRLAVARPSPAWTEAAATALSAADADALLILTLEVGQYWPRQTNWRGSKAVDLGTGHTVPLPWLTALDAPVHVLQITGALVGPDGKAIRIGSEGLVARRTSALLSGFGVQELLSDEDVKSVLAARQGRDGEGELVWRAAVRSLVEELSGGL